MLIVLYGNYIVVEYFNGKVDFFLFGIGKSYCYLVGVGSMFYFEKGV